VLYCAVNLHFFFRAHSPRRNSTPNQNHASPQPASIQHLPHSHFPYIHNLLIPKHLRTLQKKTGGIPNPSQFGTAQPPFRQALWYFLRALPFPGGNPKMNRWLFSLLTLLLAASASLADSYQIVLDRDVKVPMRDGVILKADIYRPQADGKFPVLLVRTPYDRRNEASIGVRGAQRGFVVIMEDTRGRYASEGKFYTFVNEPN